MASIPKTRTWMKMAPNELESRARVSYLIVVLTMYIAKNFALRRAKCTHHAVDSYSRESFLDCSPA